MTGGTITGLKLHRRKRARVEVYLDGERAFTVVKALAAGLRVGQHLASEDVERLRARDEVERAYARALRLLSRRPRSELELRQAFDRRRTPVEVQEAVLERLHERGLVDDRAFAEAWVENRNEFRPRGARALRMELRRKGIANETIADVLQDFDEESAALRAARKAARRWKSSSHDEFRRRLGAYLARRGFPYSIISPVVSRVWSETTDAEEEREGLP